MSKRTWMLLWTIINVSLIVSVIPIGTVGIIMHSDAIGGLCALYSIAGIFSALVMGMCTEYDFPPKQPRQPRLGRSERRALRDTQRRIALDQAIAQAEREAGIAHEGNDYDL